MCLVRVEISIFVFCQIVRERQRSAMLENDSPIALSSDLVLAHTGALTVSFNAERQVDKATLRKLTRWDLKEHVALKLAKLKVDIVSITAFCGELKKSPR